eukprot:11802361-Alexandrium_andersonii.AAC.1
MTGATALPTSPGGWPASSRALPQTLFWSAASTGSTLTRPSTRSPSSLALCSVVRTPLGTTSAST